MDFNGKRVLLTGAAGGLGQVIARAFADAGATLILSSREEENPEEVAATLPGGPHEVVTADLLVPGAPQEVVARAGRVDVMMANAGVPDGWPLDDLSGEQIRTIIGINFEVPVQMTRAVVPQMKERGSGNIVFVASMAGKIPMPDSTMYCGTKSAVRAFAWAARPELARHGIDVSVVTPGFIGEVGIFARRGRKAPPLIGVIPPRTYTRKLLAGIAAGRGEIPVGRPTLRGAAQLAQVAPGLADRIFRRAAPSRKPVEHD